MTDEEWELILIYLNSDLEKTAKMVHENFPEVPQYRADNDFDCMVMECHAIVKLENQVNAQKGKNENKK